MLFERLKEERERNGFTQPQLGAICGTKKNTVINWEKGASSPNGSQFEAMSKIGIDVSYVITGVSSQPDLPNDLAPDEHLLLDTYRALPIPKRREMLATLITGGSRKKKGGGVNSINGDNNYVNIKGGIK